MPKIELTELQLLELVALGIDNGNIQAARDLLRDAIAQITERAVAEAAKLEEES